MATRTTVIDEVLMYRDTLMAEPEHFRYMVPNDIALQ